jgi:hypothetical protein
MCVIKATVRQCVLRNANEENWDDTVSHERHDNRCVRLLLGTVMSPSLHESTSPYGENQYTTFHGKVSLQVTVSSPPNDRRVQLPISLIPTGTVYRSQVLEASRLSFCFHRLN